MCAICMAALVKRTAFRLPYVKYSTGVNRTTRTVYRAIGKPNQTAARRAFLAGCTFGEWYAETKCLFCATALFRVPASLFCILFSDKPEKSMPPEAFRTGWCRKMSLRRHPTPFRRRKDMARGAAATALQTAARLRRIRNDLLEAERLYTQTA